MRIHSMTATFGKLEHETLTLQPGLNVISAPNEWGKSTWCAFLVAMLYGIETRQKTTRTGLADKERYAPWSGSLMSGSMDITWQDRRITIQRQSTKARPMGKFAAFETDTGIAVPELTAVNCGQQLLGVEREVFLRAGFLRLSDLPIAQDEALRRRLNALVTTGDESGAADKLAQKLRELKNRCRFNQTGLLPQAQAQQREISGKLRELSDLEAQQEAIRTRQETLEESLAQLENHRAALDYAAAQAGSARLAEAAAARDSARQRLEALDAACESLPSREEAERQLRESIALQASLSDLQAEGQSLPQPPQAPAVSAPFHGLSGEDAIQMAEKDADRYRALSKPIGKPFLLLCLFFTLLGLGLALLLPEFRFLGLLPAVTGLWLLAMRIIRLLRQGREAQVYVNKYGSAGEDAWLRRARDYARAQADYAGTLTDYQAAREDFSRRMADATRKIDTLCQGGSLTACQQSWREALAAYQSREEAQREYRRCAEYAQALAAMVKPAPPPAKPDHLTHSQEETARLLANAAQEQQLLHRRLGQCQGQMEHLGNAPQLQSQLSAVNDRIQRLETTIMALTLAQNTLEEAAAALQRRFAPQIARQAQAYFTRLTQGRYEKLNLDQELEVQVRTREEDTLRASRWRSDGTVDQLYLALRLAVAQALTPEAPLVLDDALVRFDETRLAAAMEVLKEQAKEKQVILFTCQSREAQY